MRCGQKRIQALIALLSLFFGWKAPIGHRIETLFLLTGSAQKRLLKWGPQIWSSSFSKAGQPTVCSSIQRLLSHWNFLIFSLTKTLEWAPVRMGPSNPIASCLFIDDRSWNHSLGLKCQTSKIFEEKSKHLRNLPLFWKIGYSNSIGSTAKLNKCRTHESICSWTFIIG